MPLTYKYKLEALDFIVKNNSDEVQERIIAALEFAEQRQKQGYVKCLNIQNKQKNFSVPFDEICYIESIKSSTLFISDKDMAACIMQSIGMILKSEP